MIIPKIIHYCWFGKGEMPKLEKQCIESWKKNLPEFQFKLWDESNFDINSLEFTKQAYKARKYAFVSDYVRAYALYNFGGIYFDTDVEVIKPLDDYLKNEAFIGFENKTMIGTGIIGTKKGDKILREYISHYQNKNFIDSDNNIDTTTNVQVLTNIFLKYGFRKVNSEQFVNGFHVYERDFFNPKKLSESNFNVTERTVTIHHFSGSWLTEREKRRGNNFFWRKICRPLLKILRDLLNFVLGAQKAKKIEVVLRNRIK